MKFFRFFASKELLGIKFDSFFYLCPEIIKNSLTQLFNADENKHLLAIQRVPSILLNVIVVVRMRQSTVTDWVLTLCRTLVDLCTNTPAAFIDLLSETSVRIWQTFQETDSLMSAWLLHQIVQTGSLEHCRLNQYLLDQLFLLCESLLGKHNTILALPKSREFVKGAFSTSDWLLEKWNCKQVGRSPGKRGGFVQGEEASVAGDKSQKIGFDPLVIHKSEKITEMDTASPLKAAEVQTTPGSPAIIHELTEAVLIHTLVCQMLEMVRQFLEIHGTGMAKLRPTFKLQEILSEKCFKFFAYFLASSEFSENLGFEPNYPVEDASQLSLIIVEAQAESTTVNLAYSELRLLLIDSAVTTVEVLARSTSSLFLYEVYVQSGKEEGMHTLLKSSEHLLQLGCRGLRARSAILHLATNLLIFPGNGLISNRLHDFIEGQAHYSLVIKYWSNKEYKVPPSHLTTATFARLESEIEKAQELVTKPCLTLETKYISKLLELLYKFLAGMYFRYTKDLRLDFLHKNILVLCKLVVSLLQSIPQTNCGIEAQSEKVPQVTRNLDFEEKAHPKLREVRDTIGSTLLQLRRNFENIERENLSSRYFRPTTIISHISGREPWKEFEAHSLVEAAEQSLWKETSVNESTSLGSEEDRKWRNIFYEYDKLRNQSLNHESDISLLTYLKSSEARSEAFINFFGRTGEALLSEAILNKDVLMNDPESLLNADRLLKLFLKSSPLQSHIRFMIKALNGNSSIQNAYLKALGTENPHFPQNHTRNLISCMRIWMDSLCSIVLNKTFFDEAYKTLKLEFLMLGEFFRVLPSGNNQDLKKALNLFAPKVQGIPHFNESQKGMCFNLYVRQETVAVSLDVWKNTSTPIIMKDLNEF